VLLAGVSESRCGSSGIYGMIIVFVMKDDDPVQLRIEDIYNHSLSAPYSTIFCHGGIPARKHSLSFRTW
jgi:hypothetical protein